MGVLSEHFRSEGPGRESEWARQRRWFIKAKHEHQRREDIAEKTENTATAVASAASVVATPTQIKTFQSDLDTFDVSIIDALLEIEEKLDVLYADREALLAQAYVLDDGRRVFKSDDGTYVVDERGQAINPDEVDPDQVPDQLSRYSTFEGVNEEIDALKAEKQALHDALERNDSAREWAGEPGRTVEEIEAKRQDLLDDLPASARAKLDINDEPSHDIEQAAQSAPVVKTNIPSVPENGVPTKLEM